MKLMRDGINSSRHAQDYKIETITVNNNTKVPVNMAAGGGWAAILTKN